MTITLDPTLEAALNEAASKQGVAPEVLALDALRTRFLTPVQRFQPRDEWERRLLEAAGNYGVSLSDEAVSRDQLYD